MQARYPDLLRTAEEADAQKDYESPALVELAQKQLLLTKRAGAVIADIQWSDARIQTIVDALNHKISPEEALELLKE